HGSWSPTRVLEIPTRRGCHDREPRCRAGRRARAGRDRQLSRSVGRPTGPPGTDDGAPVRRGSRRRRRRRGGGAVTGSARDLLTWAARQVGTLEDPKGSNRQPFAAIAGHANALPWCATFLVAGWKANDVPLIAGTNTASTLFMHDAFSD